MLIMISVHFNKKIFWKKLLSVGICLIFILFSTPLFADKASPLKIVYTDAKPLLFSGSKGTTHGILYDIITYALNKSIQVDVEWVNLPWQRCQSYVSKGIADAIITVPTPERLKYAKTHPTSFYTRTFNIFTYPDHPRMEQIKRIKTLRNIKEGNFSIITYAGDGWSNNNVRPLGIKILEATNPSDTWKMLHRKRGDLIIEPLERSFAPLKELGLSDKIVRMDTPIASTSLHLLINKESEHVYLLQEFDAVIKQMYDDGTMQHIMDDYSSFGK